MFKAHRSTLLIAGLFLLIVVIVSAISSFWPTQESWFFELGLLGKNKMADEYFADDNSLVDVGAVNSWFIYIHNHMGNEQNVSVRVKLLNFTMELPDNREHRPSNAVSLKEFPLSLLDNETALIPFSWSLLEVEPRNGLISIKRISVNEQSVDVNVSASTNSSFRIVFELWVQNSSSGEYLFSWDSRKGFASASTYIGFKIKYNL